MMFLSYLDVGSLLNEPLIVQTAAEPAGHELASPPAKSMAPVLNRCWHTGYRMRRILWHVEGGRCCYCQKHIRRGSGTLEHVIPIAQGGADDIRNLRLACTSCNTVKANMSLRAFSRMLRRMARSCSRLSAEYQVSDAGKEVASC